MATVAPTASSDAPPHLNLNPPAVKRSSEDAELEDPYESSKRLRVTFKDAVAVRVFHHTDDSQPYEVIRDEVSHAITSHLSSPPDDTRYDQVVDLFRVPPADHDAPKSQQIRKYLQALIHSIGRLNRECSGLVHAVIDAPWLGRDEAFVQLYRQFLGNLLSAHGSYTGNVLKMLTTQFRGIPQTAGEIPHEAPVSPSELSHRLHATLMYLLTILPSASSVLSGLFAQVYPSAEDSGRAHVNFAQHSLRMAQYAPELKSEILSTITDRLVRVDVEVQVEMDRLDDDIEDTGLLEELSDDEADDLDDDASDVSLTEDEERFKNLREAIGKVDNLMDLLFEYYDGQIGAGDLPTTSADDAMDALLAQFATTILPRHRSRHTQFLIFHFAQSSVQFQDSFAGAAAHLAADRTRTSLVRTNAADYLASFIARGKRVPPILVQSTFTHLLHQAEEMRILHERNAPNIRAIRPDKTRYSLYYSYVQALLYIFCFRWRDLVMNVADLIDKGSEPLEMRADEFAWIHRIKHGLVDQIYSVFNPLKVCAPDIVNQFARIANATKFMYVYPLLEQNKRVRLHHGGMTWGFAGADGSGRLGASTAGTTGGDAKGQLSSYFPFDPYLLPKSRRWLEADYLQWDEVALAKDKLPTLDPEDGLDINAAQANPGMYPDEDEESLSEADIDPES
jgi:RNA polymerase I-specific transcription initiation factor RRN3